MTDVVVTVPKSFGLDRWIDEGEPAGTADHQAATDVDPLPYRIKVTIRNNLLLTAIEAAGFNQAQFAKACGLATTTVNMFVAMKKLPLTASGEFSPSAKVMMEVLGAAPSDLWTDRQLITCLERNTGSRNIGETTADFLLGQYQQAMLLPDPSDRLESSELQSMVAEVLSSMLTPRERDVLHLRYTEEMSGREIARRLDLSAGRICQIEAKALRKLRHKSRITKLADVCNDAERERIFKMIKVVETRDAEPESKPSDADEQLSAAIGAGRREALSEGFARASKPSPPRPRFEKKEIYRFTVPVDERTNLTVDFENPPATLLRQSKAFRFSNVYQMFEFLVPWMEHASERYYFDRKTRKHSPFTYEQMLDALTAARGVSAS